MFARYQCAHHVGLCVWCGAHLSVSRRGLWRQQREGARCAHWLWWRRWANHRWELGHPSSVLRSCTTSPALFLTFHMWLHASAVADAWRALKSPSLGESSLEGAVSGLSTTSPSEGLSAPGTLRDTPHFNTLAGGALGAHNGKYSRWETGSMSTQSDEQQGFLLIIFCKSSIYSSLPLSPLNNNCSEICVSCEPLSSILPLIKLSIISLLLCIHFGWFLLFSLKYMLVSLSWRELTANYRIAQRYWSTFSSRLEGQAGALVKESAQRETSSLRAGSDCASTRGMAGSIISSYTLPDRWHSCILLWSRMSILLAVVLPLHLSPCQI